MYLPLIDLTVRQMSELAMNWFVVQTSYLLHFDATAVKSLDMALKLVGLLLYAVTVATLDTSSRPATHRPNVSTVVGITRQIAEIVRRGI